jgi:8-oxo-dGTP pyrophosphatase MutT (NUDIX family)
MYKVFYQDRIIYLTRDFATNFFNNYGLFYKFYDADELADLLKLYSVITKIKKLYIFHPDINHLFEEFKKVFHYVEAAGGIVYNKGGQVLFIKRKNKWDLPKGKLEEDELPMEGAIRETEEETGIKNLKITSEKIDTYHIYFANKVPVLKRTQWFTMETDSVEDPTPQKEEEITEAVWFDQQDITNILGNTYLSIVDIMKQLKLLPF